MNIFHQLPNQELRPFIDRIWGWESVSHKQVLLPTLLPGTGAELYFHYGEPFRIEDENEQKFAVDRCHLFCIRDKLINLSSASEIGFIAIRFKIGMLQRFTNIPEAELADSRLSVSDIWGTSGADLTRRLSYATGNQERLAIIQHFLAMQLRSGSQDLLVEHAISMLYRQVTTLSIDSLANSFGLGNRQLERRWKAVTGRTPSASKCLIRFQQTVRSLMLDQSADMASQSLTYGYFDQAHFIHDFRRRTGQSPGHFLRLARTKTHFYNTTIDMGGILTTPHY